MNQCKVPFERCYRCSLNFRSYCPAGHVSAPFFTLCPSCVIAKNREAAPALQAVDSLVTNLVSLAGMLPYCDGCPSFIRCISESCV